MKDAVTSSLEIADTALIKYRGKGNDVTSDSKASAPVVSLPCTDGNSIEQLTPETLKQLGFKKKKDCDAYWFELKFKNWTFITNDNYYSEKEWHIGFAEREHTAEFTFLHHCTTVQRFKNLFCLLTNSDIQINGASPMKPNSSTSPDNQKT